MKLKSVSMIWKLFWILIIFVIAAAAAIILWSGPFLLQEAAGIAPFDTRSGGYSLAESQAYLRALSPAGLEIYLGPQRWIDTVFLSSFSTILMIGIYRSTSVWPQIIRVLASGLPLVYAAFDLLENAAVARMLMGSVEGLTIEMVETASRWTVWKFLAVNASLILLAAVLILRIVLWVKVKLANR